MKNPSIAAAFVLVTLALVVGGLALASGGDGDDGQAQLLVASPSAARPSFESLSPHELRKKGRLEEARRELAQIRKVGEEVAPNMFKITDESGDATLFYGDLIEGVGRNGEPLYLAAQVKRLPAVPLREAPKLPPKATPKFKKAPTGTIKFNKPTPDGGSGGDAGGGTDEANPPKLGGGSTGG